MNQIQQLHRSYTTIQRKRQPKSVQVLGGFLGGSCRKDLRILGVILGLLVALGTGRSVLAQSASLTEAYGFYEKGWIDASISAFEAVLQTDPTSLEAQLGLAMAYQKAGQDEKAWQAYGQVLNLQPDQEAALRARGILGAYQPSWHNAGIAALTQVLNRYPQDSGARSQRARLLSYQQQWAASIADYEILLADSQLSWLRRKPLPMPKRFSLWDSMIRRSRF